MNGDRIREIEVELRSLESRRRELRNELATLSSRADEAARSPLPTVDSQIELFVSMFRCRESVYPRRWENRTKGC